MTGCLRCGANEPTDGYDEIEMVCCERCYREIMWGDVPCWFKGDFIDWNTDQGFIVPTMYDYNRMAHITRMEV
jgi:hypothetical protein